jgi:predicted outer membrane repeat protein
VSGGEIANNSASYSGGIYIIGSATLEDTQVIGNSAETGGGAIIVGSATLVGTQVISNSAVTGGGMFVFGNVTLEDTQVLNNSATYGDGVFVYESDTGAAITSTTPLTISGQVYQIGGTFAASSHDLHIDGSLVMTGTYSIFDGTDGLFDAPANFTLTGPFIHTSGTYRQTRDVSGSSDVGFPKDGGVVINANGHSLGSTQVTVHANQDCGQSPTDSETVRRCYAITPTVSSGHDATITFYLNDTELNGNTCTTLDAYRWNGSDWIRHAASDRQCNVSPYSVQVTSVETVSSQWVLGPKPQLGDVNADGEVDIIDAQMTARYYVGLEPLGFHPDVADVNVDGIVDILDALIIANYYVGKIPALPWHGPLPE